MSKAVFEAVDITKKYHNIVVLDRVSMTVRQGDIYGFIGENGAGKTTMIRLLTSLSKPTAGEIKLFGEGGGRSCQGSVRGLDVSSKDRPSIRT